jgi:hypothetical protein
VEKNGQKSTAISVIFKELPKVSNHPGANSANLVTLLGRLEGCEADWSHETNSLGK